MQRELGPVMVMVIGDVEKREPTVQGKVDMRVQGDELRFAVSVSQRNCVAHIRVYRRVPVVYTHLAVIDISGDKDNG